MKLPPTNHNSSHLPPDLKVRQVPVGDLKPNPKNPRKRTRQQLRKIARSISKLGFLVPIVVGKDGVILAGHGRYYAAIYLGYDTVPVVDASHLSEAEAKAFMLADNKLALDAEWDPKILGDLLLELSDLDINFDLDLTGFSAPEIDFYIEGLNIVAPADAADNLPDEPADGPEVSKLGDKWLLGDHVVYNADATQAESYEILLGSLRVHIVFTDPPYNVKIGGHVSGLGVKKHREFAMATGEMTSEAFAEFLRTVFGLIIAYSINGSLHYVFMDWRHMQELLAAGALYAELKNICVWVKDNGGMGSLYRSRHEMVAVFKNGKAPHRNNVELGKHGRNRTNVWEYPGIGTMSKQSDEGNLLNLHPTVKPVKLVADALLDTSARGDIVLDPFLGSGTTVMAAERVGRRCYGLELDPLYVDTIIRRWQAWTGENAIHAATGKTFNELSAKDHSDD